MSRCEVLAGFSEEEGRLTRTFLSAPMQTVRYAVERWMEEAEMLVMTDEVGNLRGRYAGLSEGAPVLIIGSHLDTVRDAGKYDGVLGVLLGVAAVQRLQVTGRRLPFAVEVVGFADEEGLRFGAPFLGSLAYTGGFTPELLAREDGGGVSLAEAIEGFSGESERLLEKRFNGGHILGYLEVHIEQGPVLDSLGKPVAVVDAVAGQSRARLELGGRAGHAGTVPMTHRRDALAGAAAFVLEVERSAQGVPEMVATVGELQVAPGALNVIPDRAVLSLDLRHADDAIRERAFAELEETAKRIAAQRKLELRWTPLGAQPATRMDPRLSELLEAALGGGALRLVSGAGHDAMIMARQVPSALLFVRSPGGVSHHPDETVSLEDVTEALEVVSRFLTLLESQPETHAAP
jgi:allantoate deiminase